MTTGTLPKPNDGWEYRYEPETLFIGAYHPKGGAQSICHFPDRPIGDVAGPMIVDMLNAQGEVSDIG